MENNVLIRRQYRRPAALWYRGLPIAEVVGRSYEQIESQLQQVAGIVKITIGAPNAMCYWAIMDTIDAIKKTKRYRHEAKRACNNVLSAWQEYERMLATPPEGGVRFFSVKEMPAETRKRYGDITDREYFEYWKASGAEAYVKAKNDIGCVRHKYFKSLDSHGAKDSEELSWLFVTAALLEAAVQTYKTCIEAVTDTGIPKGVLEGLFDVFSLEKVNAAYLKAMNLIAPDLEYEVSEEENRNIELGLRDLFSKVSDIGYIYASNMSAAEQYEEVFRTKGECKKMQRLFAEAKKEVDEIS